MIFRTITDESTGATKSIGLFGKSLGDLKTTITSIKSQGLTNFLFNSSIIDDKAVFDYNAEIKNAIANNATFSEKQEIMKSAINSTNKATARLIESTRGAVVSTEALTAAQKASTVASKAASVGMNAVAMAANMAIMLAITKGIELAVNAIDKAVVTNEEYLEQQNEIISKAEETISVTKPRISALEELQEKIKATNGVQSEMLKLSKDINTVLGEGKSKILEQADAYEVLNEQLAYELGLLNDKEDKANQEKRDAAFENIKNIMVTNTSGNNKEMPFGDLMGISGFRPVRNDSRGRYNNGEWITQVQYNLGGYIKEYLQPIIESGGPFTVQDVFEAYKNAISEYNNLFDEYRDKEYMVNISDEELQNGIEEVFNNLYVAFDDIINNGEGFLDKNAKEMIISNMFFLNNGVIDDAWRENVYKVINELDSKKDEINSLFSDYNAALKDNIEGNEKQFYNSLSFIFAELEFKNPEISNILDDYFNTIIDGIQSNAKKASEEMSQIHNIFDIDFSQNTETIDNFQSKLSSLGSTYSKLLNGNYTGSELIDMLQELQAAGTDLTTLESIQDLDDAILNLNADNVNSLIKSLNIEPTSDLAAYLRNVADEAIKVTSALEGTTGALSNIQNGYTTLSGALEEYNENGFLTIDTLNKVLTLEPEYLSCLIDENGQLQLNKEAYMQLAIAQIEKAKQAVIDEAAVKMDQLAHEGLSTSTQATEQSQVNFGNKLPSVITRLKDYALGLLGVTEATRGVTGAQLEQEVINGNKTIEDVRKIYDDLSGIQKEYGEEIIKDMYAKISLMEASEDEIDSVFSSISGSSASKSSSSTSDNALDAIHKLIDLRIQMIKDMKQEEIDAIQKIIDAEKEKLDAIKETIDARKEAIQVLKEEEEHEDELAEKNKAVSDIQSQIDSLSRDNSASAAKKRRELEEELAEAQKDLSDYISDYEYDQAVDALDKEAEAAEKAYEEEEKRLQSQIDSIQGYIDNEKQLYQDAMNDLNGMSNKLFEDMKRWGEETTGEVWEVVDAWTAALEALQKYNAVSNVATIHDKLHGGSSSGNSSGNSNNSSSGGNSKQTGSGNYKATHTVQKGETLWSIAVKYYGDGSKWTKIQDANNVNPKTLPIGKKLYIPYKNGTLSVPRDSLALIDETGEELVLHANEHGKLTHLTKGSSVIPADITERLLAWAQNAPDVFSSNLRRHIPDLQRPDNRTWGKPTVTIGDIYINGNMGSLTRADLADFRKDIVNDVYESMQKNRVKSGRY